MYRVWSETAVGLACAFRHSDAQLFRRPVQPFPAEVRVVGPPIWVPYSQGDQPLKLRQFACVAQTSSCTAIWKLSMRIPCEHTDRPITFGSRAEVSASSISAFGNSVGYRSFDLSTQMTVSGGGLWRLFVFPMPLFSPSFNCA